METSTIDTLENVERSHIVRALTETQQSDHQSGCASQERELLSGGSGDAFGNVMQCFIAIY
jgi:hypothetical protein